MNETPDETLKRICSDGELLLEGLKRKKSLEGFRRFLTDIYPDKAHFIYELLQNAEDAQATEVAFQLFTDRLIVSHNGSRIFTTADVESITAIGDSTKRDDVNQIGRFGVGFKAVFGFTETPRITSGEFSFEIRDLFCPHPHPRLVADKTKTVFEFPLKQQNTENIHSEVLAGLKAMRDSTLLFLRNIRKISWRSGSGSVVVLERISHGSEIVEIVRKNHVGGQNDSSLWLRFEEPAKLFTARTVAIACRLEFRSAQTMLLDERTLSQQVKIADTDGKLHVFFPTEKEQTGLRFHLHGPYSTTVARDSIPTHNPENRALLAQTAGLIARSLERIRDLGLLDRDCLNVLPNSRDELREFFTPVRDRLLAALKEKPLIPTQNGGHAPGRDLCTGSSGIDGVIGNDDLAILRKLPGLKWSIRVPIDTDAAQLLRDLGMPEMRWKEMFECITARFSAPLDDVAARWLAAKDDEWMYRFYEMLHNVLTELSHFDTDVSKWDNDEARAIARNWRIVRIKNGEHRTAVGTFFPSEDDKETGFPTVRRLVFEAAKTAGKENNPHQRHLSKAHRFLLALGVKQVDERAQIERLLAKYYAQNVTRPSWSEHLLHLGQFVAYCRKNVTDEDLFSSFAIFAGEGDGRWLRAREAFLDDPHRTTGLTPLFAAKIVGIPNLLPLSSRYTGENLTGLADFAAALGAKVRLVFLKSTTDDNLAVRELHAGGGRRTGSKTDDDYILEYLTLILPAKSSIASYSAKIAHLIWRTMCNAPRTILTARYRANAEKAMNEAHSQIVWRLRNTAWLPGKTDGFLKPADMTRENLLPEFSHDNDNGWLTAIGFGSAQSQKSKAKDERRKAAESIGIPGELLEALEGLLESEKKQAVQLFVEELNRRKRVSAGPVEPADFETKVQEAFNRPGKTGDSGVSGNDSSIADPERRARKIAAEIEKDRENERGAGERQRAATRTVWEAKDPQTSEFLLREYAGHCQICDRTFRQRNGDPYFEAVHLVSRAQDGTAWTDRSGNALCLCPTCCAKFKYGAVERDDFVEQVKSLKLRAEGGTSELKVLIRLCGDEVSIRYKERHFLELRQMLHAPTIAPSRLATPLPQVSTDLVQCPHCPNEVRHDRLETHLANCHGTPAPQTPPRHGLRIAERDETTQSDRCRDCGKRAMPGDDRCYSCA